MITQTDKIKKQSTQDNINCCDKSLSIVQILKYSVPEMLSTLFLVILPIILDLYFVSKMCNNISMQAFGISTNILHLLGKISEAAAITATTFIGINFGASKTGDVGKRFRNSLLTCFAIGLLLIAFIWITSGFYCTLMGAQADYALFAKAKKYLRLQAVASLIGLLFMCFVGLFRGIKDSKTPMLANFISISIFLGLDYALIFGYMGFSAHGIMGSAIASIIRYSIGTFFLFFFSMFSKKFENLNLFNGEWINLNQSWEFISFCLPIIFDKSVISLAYIWLYSIIAPTLPNALLIIEVTKNLERLAFIPATAFAVVANFIISNNIGEKKFDTLTQNLKNILFLTIATVLGMLVFLKFHIKQIVHLFGFGQSIVSEVSLLFNFVIIFVLFDAAQVVLASVIRSFGQSYFVMFVRSHVFIFIFGPASLIINHFFKNSLLKLTVTYAAFYSSIAIAGIIFLIRVAHILKKLKNNQN